MSLTTVDDRHGANSVLTDEYNILSVFSYWSLLLYLRHEQYGKTYVPLKWSKALADEARAWAEQLAEDCELYHDPNTNHGENIALNYGWDEYSTRRTTENVLSSEFIMQQYV